jgi:hypothetical protein
MLRNTAVMNPTNEPSHQPMAPPTLIHKKERRPFIVKNPYEETMISLFEAVSIIGAIRVQSLRARYLHLLFKNVRPAWTAT